MAEPSPLASGRKRRALGWSLAWLFSAALYLLLIDTISLPELSVGGAGMVLAATGAELAREQGLVGETVRLRWLGKLYRAFLATPRDVAFVSLAALRALVRRPPATGRFRAVSFGGGEPERLESGRRALAESFGSFAPNTIVVGVDPETDLILVHQLWVQGGREAVDVLELG